MKRRYSVEFVTLMVAIGLVLLWVATHYVMALLGLSFDKSFLAQLGNMAMLALGVLGIGKAISNGQQPPTEPSEPGLAPNYPDGPNGPAHPPCGPPLRRRKNPPNKQ